MVAKIIESVAPKNLLELLRNQARTHPDGLACAYLGDDGDIRARLSYSELDNNARAIAARLQGLDAGGECAVLLYPPGLNFVSAFFACMYANVVAIPLPIPRTTANINQTKGIIEETKTEIILSTQTILTKLARQDEQYFSKLICLDTQEVDADFVLAWRQPENPAGDTLAYFQYTSGSTSARKGVMISHANVLENIKGIDRGFQHDQASIAVNWLPHFHDLGLVSGILQPLYHGVPNYLMAPTALVQKPIRWLQAISNFRATHTNSPNYAYDLCVKKITEEQQQTLDLSAWRVALNGAEPVRAETVRDFYSKFKNVGLAKTTMYPAYGLAEATLVVSAGLPASEPKVLQVDAGDLQKGQVSLSAEAVNSRELVACGTALHHTVIAIVDPQTGQMAAKNTIGEIWVNGPAVAAGYWQNPAATEETFRAVLAEHPNQFFLRTGDLGFLHEGLLYITGREKDLIIIRGANHYPQDIEWTVENAHAAFKPGCGAAFSIKTEGEEKLVVVYELEREHVKNFDVKELVRSVRAKIAEEHDLQLPGLVLLKTASVPRTSSGKIQRRQCQHEFLENQLTEVARWINEPTETEATGEGGLDHGKERSSLQIAQANTAQDIIAWLRIYAEKRLNSLSYDERRSIPPHVLLDFGNRGILGMQVAKQYGGLGLATSDVLKVIEQLGAIDQTLAMMCIVHNTLGILPIERAAKEESKHSLLPRLACGRELVAFAMTEPGAGSNPRAITTKATKAAAGKWRISGEKSWSGTAGWASVVNVFAQNIELNGEPRGMVGFSIPMSSDGITIGPEAKTFGMRGMVQNTIYFDNVVVDESQLLGEPGDGMNVAQHAMQRGRLMIAAACIGGMKRCTQLMARYGQNREISTGKLLANGVWSKRLLEISTEIFALECLVAHVGVLEDESASISPDIFAALKITAPEFFWSAADSFMQMLGGRGYIETNVAPQLLRDARVARILEGPTEAIQMFLGARVSKDAKALYEFLDTLCRDDSVSERLKQACSLHTDQYGSNHVLLCKLGELAAQAILLATIKARLHSDSHLETKYLQETSLNWAERRFTFLIGQAAESAGLVNEIKVDKVLDIVNSYRMSIGDVEQQLLGLSEELDPLLRRSTAESPQTRMESEVVPISSDNSEPRVAVLPGAIDNNRIQAQSDSLIEAGTISTFMVQWLDKELKLAAGTVHANQSFCEHGVDSVVSVMLTVAIEEEFGLLVEPEVIYDYQRIDRCATEIARLIASEESRQ